MPRARGAAHRVNKSIATSIASAAKLIDELTNALRFEDPALYLDAAATSAHDLTDRIAVARSELASVPKKAPKPKKAEVPKPTTKGKQAADLVKAATGETAAKATEAAATK